ncbi:UNVERIFIED_CONTAM: HAMP domain-containing sensor histidine kinase [Bacillus cereus]|uniref:HAMP domain-containing sensor histidine kinase n=1 Tax=Bacillus TaxID=1386 RepID=UPI000ECE03C6|nr:MULTISPECIES: HAMP domain-containing sensor histidine kinase [Bacillus cereus group]HCX52471.1 two-component sensor histidine kinase [Bacillus sp. (in: firmicutes)]MDA2565214.1 HAMP domain-containing sensor histidine kinase [Bacillus cereus]MDA2570260.1 HAMP domain-containing sensor histidine kinase [Bacillus cereus]MDZ4479229.1 HAMP domain-containing sensor histidine kinase [Bacillus cereus]MDZ4517699.1 HAMP domain-containing sensor histidine kinase [Bacillus cereus]
MKNVSFRNKIIIKLLGAVAISFFISFGLTILIVQYVIDPFFIKHEDFGMFEVRLAMLFLFTFAILNFIVIFLLLVRKKIVYLKLISENVNDIANGKLGLTIGIKGKDELTQLAQNINYMSKELENTFEQERRLERTKNELITNVSHDLRTPLTSIIGYIDLLKRGQYNSKIQLQEYLETTYLKSKRLKYLIDELFEYTRLSGIDAKLNLNEVDLSGLLEQIVGEYIPIFEKESLIVQKSITQETIPIFIDVEKMVRVYENLFMNAIKYSMKPSELSICLELIGNKAMLKVSNKVERPPVSDPNKLFERFFRGDKARKDDQGNGLGLAIAKRIVELHHGNIHAEYKDGWMSFIVEHPIR